MLLYQKVSLDVTDFNERVVSEPSSCDRKQSIFQSYLVTRYMKERFQSSRCVADVLQKLRKGVIHEIRGID